MSDAAHSNRDDVVDPQVRLFVSQVSRGFASHPGFDALPHPQARAVAEQVRGPWREGGPRMAQVREMRLPEGPEGVRVRIYEPAASHGAGLKAALVYLHGGGWTLFSLDTHDRVMREYAARSGMAVIGVDYALSPEAKFPVAQDQIVGVVRWLRARGREIGVDPDRLAIGGDSAGGNLALTTCLRLRDAGESQAIRAMLLNYGAFDSDCSDAAASQYGGDGFMLTRPEMDQYWSNYLRSPADAADPLACPARAKLEGLPPAFLAIAECDVLAEQNLVMAERMTAAGVEAKAVVYPGATHSFLEAVSISDLAGRALQDASLWLKAKTAAR